jgi:D-alanyl-D-alanine carboxypeptidase
MMGFYGASRPCRPRVGRALLVLLSALAMLGATAGHAFSIESLRKYAAVVVDAKSGEVLYDKDADARRYPASLTKVMTLYILFQELEAGNVRLTDRMTVSEHAAAAVPTKLGLKPGWTITVADAMKSLVTLSANDMARVIAEHIAGSESAFAERMTETARALGMDDTTYRNASGLPDAAQVTTARDQATLGIAVNQHFPQYYDLFQTKRFTHAGRSFGNHNRLLGSNGVDGIKTGYIKASGFNLLTAARRDDRHIVVAAIGSNTGAARDDKVRQLVKTYLSKGRTGTYLEAAMIPEPGRLGTMRVAAAQPVTPKPYPAFRQAELQVAGLSGTPAAAAGSAPQGPSAMDAANLLGSASAGSPTELRAPLVVMDAFVGETHALTTGPVVTGEGDTELPAESSTDAAAALPDTVSEAADTAALAPAAPAPAASGWVVQVGAAPSPEGADTLLKAAAEAVAPLQELQSFVQRFEKGEQVFYRARFAGFGTLTEARSMCKRLLEAEMNCLALMS